MPFAPELSQRLVDPAFVAYGESFGIRSSRVDSPEALRKELDRYLARNDIEQAVGHYLAEAGATLVLDFIDTLEASLNRIGEQPESGSARPQRPASSMG